MNKCVAKFNDDLKIGERVESFLLACIVCMNIVRFAFATYETSFLLYSIYLIFVLIGALKHKNKIKIKCSLLSISVLLLLFVAFVSSLFADLKAISSSMKLILSVAIAIVTFNMSFEQIFLVIKYIIIMNIAYCVYILIFTENVYAYIDAGGDSINYLTVTLTIGLTATILLSYAINNIFINSGWLKIFLALCGCLIAFLAMLKFAARGALVLPIIAVAIVYILLAINNKRKFIFSAVILISIAILFLCIYVRFADPYLIKRMVNLFKNISNEERIIVWTQYWHLIFDKAMFIFGGGVNSSVELTGYYPHNIYLQLLGEFGILGILVASVFTVRIFRNIRTCNKGIKQNIGTPMQRSMYYVVLGAFLYYFLTFMKSFTLYDAYPLFIFCAFLFRMEKEITNIKKQKNQNLLVQ